MDHLTSIVFTSFIILTGLKIKLNVEKLEMDIIVFF